MDSYVNILLYLALAEFIRRCCLVLIRGLTGPLSKIPGPFMARFTGLPWSYQLITGNHMNSVDPLVEKYGDIVRVAPNHLIVADKPSVQKIMIEQDLPKDPIVAQFRAHKNVPTLFLETEKSSHKHVRRLLSNGFSLSYLNGLEPIMQECVDEFEKNIDSEISKSKGFATIDMYNMASNLTFDVMSATSLGGSFHTVTSRDMTLKKAFTTWLKLGSLQSQLPFLHYMPFKQNLFSVLIGAMEQAMRQMIAKRKAEKGPPRRDLLQIILDAHETDPVAFPSLRIEEEMKLFMVAGSETTSNSIIMTLLQLVNNPRALKILVEELDKTFPSQDDAVTFAKTQDLAYLNGCVLEAQRLMVQPAVLFRYTTERTMLSDHEIPANTTVQPWPKTLMLNDAIFPDAEKYVPERWLGEYKGSIADRKDVYSFSAGSRNCIGQQFALREMRIVLARLLRRYEVSLVPGQSHERRNHTAQWFVQGFYKIGVKKRNFDVR